jgi:hypothetical protein
MRVRALDLKYWGVIARGAAARGAQCFYFDELDIYLLDLPRR